MKCAASNTANWNTTIVTTVSPAISNTSHPFHTGFSTGGGPAGIGGMPAGANESSAFVGVDAGASAVTGGSNCGLSEDDKSPFPVLFVAYSTICHPERSEGPMQPLATCTDPSRPRTPLRMTALFDSRDSDSPGSKRSAENSQKNILPAPAPYTTSSPAPRPRAFPARQRVRRRPRPRDRDQ